MSDQDALVGAIDIGGTKIAVGLVMRDGRVVVQRSLKTSDYATASLALDAVEKTLRACVQECAVKLAGIGIGCTGPVDPIRGVVGKVANLPGWEGCAIVDELARRMGVIVVMENDADAAAVGEAVWGSGRGVDRFLYVTLSTGIGTGFIVDGAVYRGVDGAHPEMGHHGLDPHGPRCYCGAHGCWESLASGTALRDWYLEQEASGRYDVESLSAEDVFSLCRKGDPLAQRAIERLSEHVGLGLANLTMILVPGTIALGGGMMRAADMFLNRAVQTMRSKCLEVPVEKVVVRTAALREDVGLSGAAAVWLRAQHGL